MSERVTFVSCVKSKARTERSAQDLYISDLFRKARSYAETLGDPWFILSAEHGLLRPETKIEPYEKTLKNMGIRDRRAWSSRVLSQIENEFPDLKHATFLAGKDYRELIVPSLKGRGIEVAIPMEGLPFGKQLSWLGQQIRT